MGMIEFGSREEIRALYDRPANRRLRRMAVGAISVSALILFSILAGGDNLSHKSVLILKGCAGAGALVFIVLYGWLMYRVNRAKQARDC